MPLRKIHPYLPAVLLTALALRLIWALLQPTSADALAKLPDQQEYLSIGKSVATDGQFAFVDPRFHQTVYAYRMPGYPLLIAACGSSPAAVRILQAIVDTTTVLAVAMIALAVSQSRACALAAASVMAINPFSVYFSGLLLSETCFTALLTWGLYLLIARKLWLATALLALACHFRPTALLVSPVLVFVAVVNSAALPAYSGRRRLLADTLAGLFACLMVVIVLLPWAIRNQKVFGQRVWTTTNSGITLYDGFHDGADGSSDQKFLTVLPRLVSINEVDRSRLLAKSASDWAFHHPAELPMLSVRKILRGWSPVPLSVEFGRPLYRVASAVYAVPFDLLCLLGLVVTRLSYRSKIVLITPAVLVTLLQVLSVGSIRYRIPAEPALAVLVGVGVVATIAAVHRRLHPPTIPHASVQLARLQESSVQVAEVRPSVVKDLSSGDVN